MSTGLDAPTLTWELVSERMAALAEQRGDWAGYPLPVDELRLRVSRGFPYQDANGMRCEDEATTAREEAQDREYEELARIECGEGAKIVNEWICWSRGWRVIIVHAPGRGAKHFHAPVETPMRRLILALNTMGASRVWRLEAEIAALQRLRDVVSDAAYGYYITVGAFLETSKRSGVVYWFRRGRPTIAMRAASNGDMRIIAVLCLHPLGYYEQSFAGSMVPTDDVMAHLLLMRADEPKFWAKANHHSVWEAEAGI